MGSGVDTKRCRVCERDLPLWRFAYWRAQCKQCLAMLKRLKYAAKKEQRDAG